MSEKKISNQWTCECSTVNPLRKKRCVCCGCKISDDFLNAIYKEEISIQSIFFRKLRREKEVSRCKKAGYILTKFQTLAVILAIAVLVVCNGARFYYFPDTVNNFTDDYIVSRENRFTNELPDFTHKFTGIKQIPSIIGYVWTSVGSSVADVKEGFSEDRNRNSLKEDKINHIEERIMEVVNYVTGKFR